MTFSHILRILCCGHKDGRNNRNGGPDRLSPDQRMCAGSLMAFCPGALKQCVEMSKDDFESLPSPREAEKVQSYCVRMCDLAIPLRPMQVPGPPFLMPSQNMSRKQMAALLM